MLAPVSTNTSGQSTPLSAAAQVNVPVAVMHHSGHNPSPQHPYAAGGFEYPRGEATTEDAYTQPTVWSSFAHDVRCCTTGSSVAAVRLTADWFRKTGYDTCHGFNNRA
jgi:hypothetical protein